MSGAVDPEMLAEHPPSRGAQLLAGWLGGDDRRWRAMAPFGGSFVDRVLSGELSPEADVLETIEELTRAAVPVVAWSQPPRPGGWGGRA